MKLTRDQRKFKVGDRVYLNREWRSWGMENVRLPQGKAAVITSLSKTYPECVNIRFNGYERIQCFHHSFLSKVRKKA